MPKIDNVKRITVEDASEESKEAVGIVANYYNYFAEQVTNALNGNIDIDNLNRDIVQFTLTLDANNQPVATTRFSAINGLVGTNIIRVDNLTNSAVFPNAGPILTWRASGDGFYTVLHIAGLEPFNEYRVVVELVY